MLVRFILVQMSYPGKKAVLRCCNCSCSGTFCGLEMLKSQPFLILPYQQKLLQAHPAKQQHLKSPVRWVIKCSRKCTARAGGGVRCFQQSQLPGGPTCPSEAHPDVDVRWSKLEVSAVGPKNAGGMETRAEAAWGIWWSSVLV